MIMLDCQQREECSRQRLSNVFIERSSVPGKLERAVAHKSLSHRKTRLLLVHGGNISDACGEISAIIGVMHGHAGQAQLWRDRGCSTAPTRPHQISCLGLPISGDLPSNRNPGNKQESFAHASLTHWASWRRGVGFLPSFPIGYGGRLLHVE